MSLKKLRGRIDKIDKKIVDLLNERAKLVSSVARIKSIKKMSIFSPEREALILRKIKAINKGPLSSKDVEVIYREILSVCRALRVMVKVGYLGPEGTFTHLAAIRKFGSRSQFLSCDSIREVFEHVERAEVDYGVVPIENSIEGAVTYTLDMFLESSLKICAEVFLNVFHSLLRASETKRLLRIYSHPQVFSQCRRWIISQYPNAQLIPTSTTAKAAQMAKKDRESACIGNHVLAAIYGLKEIRKHIEDSPSNVTRFLVISKNDSLPSTYDKTSILFFIKDKVGALHDALNSFKRNGINLTKIESRPSKKRPWEYYFFVDFEGHRENKNVSNALKSLEKKCAFLKILGSYPREDNGYKEKFKKTEGL